MTVFGVIREPVLPADTVAKMDERWPAQVMHIFSSMGVAGLTAGQKSAHFVTLIIHIVFAKGVP